MPYCEKCGSQISENASFCHSCGARAIGEVEINDACVSDENTYQEDEIPSRKIGEVYKYNVAAIGGILTACTTLYISIDVIIKQINASQHKYWYPREGTYTTPGYNPGTITFNVILSIIAVIILVISIKKLRTKCRYAECPYCHKTTVVPYNVQSCDCDVCGQKIIMTDGQPECINYKKEE